MLLVNRYGKCMSQSVYYTTNSAYIRLLYMKIHIVLISMVPEAEQKLSQAEGNLSLYCFLNLCILYIRDEQSSQKRC